MHCWQKIACILAGVALCLGLLCGAILSAAYDQNLYLKQYEKLGVAQEIGLTEEGLHAVTQKLIGYCRGAEESLQIEVEVHGVLRPFFSERELLHMVDVQKLFGLANWLCPLLCLPGVALAGFAIFARRSRLRPGKYLLYGMGAGLAVIAGAGIYALLDFTAFWTAFHHLFFTNDLWLLNPAVDLLINLVPEGFFSAIVGAICLRFALMMVVATGVCALGIYRQRKGKHEHAK